MVHVERWRGAYYVSWGRAERHPHFGGTIMLECMWMRKLIPQILCRRVVVDMGTSLDNSKMCVRVCVCMCIRIHVGPGGLDFLDAARSVAGQGGVIHSCAELAGAIRAAMIPDVLEELRASVLKTALYTWCTARFCNRRRAC